MNPYTASRVPDTRAGNNANHQDTHVDALIDRLREAPTEEACNQAGHDLQRYIVEQMVFPSVAPLPLFQAHRTNVKGYEPLHGFKLRSEPTWIEGR
ncbi:MAG TPA: hypothetical protein VLK82_09060 [Candidatus Tectomicrobia bacterium]|nr:hypothetical protein [Candidatus Tectomicrobia bacterium]